MHSKLPVKPSAKTITRFALFIFSSVFLLWFVQQLSLRASWAESTDAGKRTAVSWVPYTETVFTAAKQSHKLVLLDLEAVWCHWCHVMEEKTYGNQEVANYIAAHYIAVKADQDSRPDLSNAFSDYGWPATIIFDDQGTPIAKRSGFVPPEEFLPLLKEKVARPTPEPEKALGTSSPSASGQLPIELRDRLMARHYLNLDQSLGGLDFSQRYLPADALEFALENIRRDYTEDIPFTKITLKNNRKLIDPVWGGSYQYSTDRDWDHPHFEKIMEYQEKNLRIYSLAALALENPDYLLPAKSVYGFVRLFLQSPEGAFYTSQDADLVPGEHSAKYFELDDNGRRKLGIPKIDRHRYARENGWLISALIAYSSASGEEEPLTDALKAATWILKERRLPGGGFRHDQDDGEAGPYLGDTLAMGQACLSLYGATGDREWLRCARESAEFVGKTFREGGGVGFFSFDPRPARALKPVRLNDENIRTARFLNLLASYTGNAAYRDDARAAMRFLALPENALRYHTEPGILTADRELAQEPIHVTVIGAKGDPQAKLLMKAALMIPTPYKRTEWWDRTEGALPSNDVQYPVLQKAAAFVCTANKCSLPLFNPADVLKRAK